MSFPVNFEYLKKSRPKLKGGDIFAYKILSRYYFGRVVFAALESAPMPGASLLYFYRQNNETPVADLELMGVKDLLLPPVWTNTLGWARGYFINVGHKAFEDRELPLVHCFVSAVHGGKFLNQTGEILDRRHEPCGDWMLVRYRWIDDHISDKLGIPRVPAEVAN